ncbi:MAG TPA: rod shape-determining protein [Cyclobacteriaceae bacterium]|nr:rod shape-determining protein [Cyclobacteriaceae bacterium]
MIPSLYHSRHLAIDLGNNNTLLSDCDQLLLSEPSYIVFDANTNKVKAIGGQAFDIFGKNNEDLKPVQPLKWGVIADYNSAHAMIAGMVQKIFKKRSVFSGYNEVIAGVPYAATAVEQRALREVLAQFDSRKCHLVYEPIAAALGMGLNIREPEGKMVIDIGGGITEIVIISLSGVAVFRSIKVAGDTFTENIQDYLRRKYNLQVGWKTAEQVKIKVGVVKDKVSDMPEPMQVKGKDLMLGLPVERRITPQEILNVLDKPFRFIEDQIIQALEVCPPELSADIYQNGLHVTGGGALLKGLKQRLENSIQVPVTLDPTPLLSVSKGISKVLANPKQYAAILM